MSIKRMATRFAAILLTICILLSVPSVTPDAAAKGLDFSLIESKLNTWQYYLCRTVMSVSLKDYFDTGVLPSITAGQFFYEGGAGGYPISIIAQNHFGIKMHSWDGKVFDHKDDVVYNSYADLVNIKGESYAKKASLWRAYDSLEASIADHSALLLMYDRYDIVLEAKDYEEAAYALVKSGYCSGETYAVNLIKFITSYGFDQLDEVKKDENGVFGMIMDRSRVDLALGQTDTLTAAAYPPTEASLDVKWSSSDPTVATVDQNGNIVAVGQGYTLITAVYNGKEACSIVCVDTNAHVMNQSLAIFSEPSSDSNSLGKLVRGQPVRVNSETIYTDEDGITYYSISARVGSKNTPISGYASATNIHISGDARLSVGTPTTVFRVDPGEIFQIPVEVYAAELQGKAMTWRSSNSTVASVDSKGNVVAVSEGLAMISLAFDGVNALTVTVYVGHAAYEVLVANKNVYLRAEPTSGAEKLGLIRTGEEVRLILDPGTGWYQVLAVIDGVPMEGYCYSTNLVRPDEEPPSQDPSDDPSTDEPDPPSEDTTEEPSDDPSGDTSGGETGGGSVITYPVGQVDVEDSLNVRATPGTTGEKIAKLGNGTQVLILEGPIHVESEAVYTDWYHIRFTYQNEEMEGYVSTEYILLVGSVEVPVDPPPPSSPTYPVEDLFVVDIPAGTTLETFLQGFERKVRIYRADGTELTAKDVIGTGDEIRFYIGQTVIYTRQAVVKGDMNGDGSVTAVDYMMAKRTVLGTYTPSPAAFRAAAVTNGVTVRAMDYVKIKRVVLGTYAFPV